MKVLRWLDRHFEETIMLILLAMIVVVMGIQVVMRYGLKSSLVWAEELSRYFFHLVCIYGNQLWGETEYSY